MSRFVRGFLHQLGLMRTAVALLALCALASLAGTIVPQGLPVEEYVAAWGPVGAQVLWHAGLTDVFRAWWFLGIFGFLLVSVGVCLWRNGPVIWRQLRMPRRRPELAGAGFKVSEAQLREAGFARTGTVGGAALWQRGRVSRAGYFLVHVGVLGVAVAGLLTGFVGWRGTMNLREGETDNVALVWRGREAVPHFLPFAVTNAGFDITHYDSGMPKNYSTRLRVGGNGEEHVVEVNRPLAVGGYRFYQASFGDGGSLVKGLGVDLLAGTTQAFDGSVYGEAKLADGTRIEILDFRPFTVETMPGAKPTDVGPSVDYLVQPPDRTAVQLRAYLNHPGIVGVADGVKRGGMDEGSVVYRPVWLGVREMAHWPLVARVAAGGDYKEVTRPALEKITDVTERVVAGVAIMNAAKLVKELGLTHVLVLEDFQLRRYSGLQVVYDPAANLFWMSGVMLLLGVVLMVGRKYARMWVVKGRGYGNWRP